MYTFKHQIIYNNRSTMSNMRSASDKHLMFCDTYKLD